MNGRIVARYDYLSAKGEPRLRKLRFDPKAFQMKSADWQDERGVWWYRNGVTDERFEFWTQALYRLPEVVAALRVDVAVWWCEGEKDADTLAGLGLITTTTPNPSDLWAAQCDWFTRFDTGSDVVVVCDYDEHGGWWGWQRYKGLLSAGVHRDRIHVVAPPWPIKDVTDMVDAGLGTDALRIVSLRGLRWTADRYSTNRAARYLQRAGQGA
jgi:hypothetical protein